MSSFNLQGGQIRGALVAAGLPAAAATQISNILSNCAQTLKHAGPIEHDKTPSSMRLVTPESRKYELPNLDFRQSDPDYRAPSTQPSEERRLPQQAPAIESSQSPQQTESTFRVTGGPFVAAAGTGDAVQVGLRVQGFGRVATLDPPSNTIIGKTLRAAGDAGDNSRLRFFIEETGQEIVWNLQLQNVGSYEVVTGVQYVDGVGLVVTYSKIAAWQDSNSSPRTEILPATPVPVVSDVTLGVDGINVIRQTVDVLGVSPARDYTIPTETCEDQ